MDSSNNVKDSEEDGEELLAEDNYEDDEYQVDDDEPQVPEVNDALLEESQTMDEAINILNDPIALSTMLKKQYDDVAEKNASDEPQVA